MDDPMDQLRRLVLADPTLCRALSPITDRRRFVALVAAVAREHAMPLDGDDIDRALDAARRCWRQRWV